MIKRILATLLATMLLLSFASCKPEDDTSRPDESQNESNASEEASKDEAKTVETKYFGTLTEITDSDGRKGCLFKAEEWEAIDSQSITKEYIEDFVSDLETAASGYEFITVDLGEGASMTAEYTKEPSNIFDYSSETDTSLPVVFVPTSESNDTDSVENDTFLQGKLVTPFGSYNYITNISEKQYQSIKSEGNTVTFTKHKAVESTEETYVLGYIEFIRLIFGLKPDANAVRGIPSPLPEDIPTCTTLMFSSLPDLCNSWITITPEKVAFTVLVFNPA